jgi:hypothetical protein
MKVSSASEQLEEMAVGNIFLVVLTGGAASVASFLAAVLTEIYLCNACSCQEVRTETPRTRVVLLHLVFLAFNTLLTTPLRLAVAERKAVSEALKLELLHGYHECCCMADSARLAQAQQLSPSSPPPPPPSSSLPSSPPPPLSSSARSPAAIAAATAAHLLCPAHHTSTCSSSESLSERTSCVVCVRASVVCGASVVCHHRY